MIGDIILLNRNKGGWFSSAQRFFTGMPFTHCTVSVGNVLGEEYVLSAEEKILLLPLYNYFTELDGSTDIYVFRPSVDIETKAALVVELADELINKWYGFGQLPWFIYRWFMEKLGKDVRKSNNWFKSGYICSEVVYLYLEKLARKNEPEKLTYGGELYELNQWLSQYTQDTVHAGDIYTICASCRSIPLEFKRMGKVS